MEVIKALRTSTWSLAITSISIRSGRQLQ